MSDFQIVENEDEMQYVPMHVMQQGGTTPIQAPLLNIGETTPMIFQAASQPVDTGVQAAIRFAGLSQQRRQQRFREYSFEIESKMAREGLDLQREMFEWKKRTWSMDFDYRAQNDLRNNIIALDSIINGASGNNPQTVYGKAGSQAGPSRFKTPGQVAIGEATDQTVNAQEEEVMNWLKEDPNVNPAALTQARNKINSAYSNPDYVAATNQAAMYEQQLQELNSDTEGKKWDYELAAYKQEQYFQSEDVKEPVNILYRSSKSMIDEMITANKEVFNLPELVDMGAGLYQAIKKNPQLGEQAVKWLKSDPYGTYDAKFKFEMESGRLEEDTDYNTWLDAKVRSDMDAYGATGLRYDTIGSPTKGGGSSSSDSGSPGALPHGYMPNRRPTLGIQIQAKEPSIAPGSDEYDTVFGIDYQGLDFSGGEADITGGTLERGPYGASINKGEGQKEDGRVGYHLDPGNEIATKWFKSIISMETGTPVPDIEMSDYMDEDGWFTEEGARVKHAYRDKESLRHTLQYHEYSTAAKSGGRGNESEFDRVNKDNEWGKKDFGGAMFFDPQANNGKGEMLTEEDMNAYIAASDGVTMNWTGYVDNKNILSIAARQHNTGVLDPVNFGVEPRILKVTGGDSENPVFRTFFVPQDQVWLDAHPEKIASHKAYMQASAGKGSSVPLSFDDAEKKGIIADIMSPVVGQINYDHEYIPLLRDLNTSIESVKLADDGTGNSVGITYNINDKIGGATGSVTVTSTGTAADSRALVLANTVSNLLGSENEFEIVENYHDAVGHYYSISINGEEAQPINGNNPRLAEQQLEDILNNAGKPILDYPIQENGVLPGFRAMQPVPTGSTVIPKFNKKFYNEFNYLDELMYRDDLSYKLNSGYRSNNGSLHSKGRAVDIQYRESTSLDTFFEGVAPGFKRSKDQPGGFSGFSIEGTSLWVSRHRNKDLKTGLQAPGWHYHVYMPSDDDYKPEDADFPLSSTTSPF